MILIKYLIRIHPKDQSSDCLYCISVDFAVQAFFLPKVNDATANLLGYSLNLVTSTLHILLKIVLKKPTLQNAEMLHNLH